MTIYTEDQVDELMAEWNWSLIPPHMHHVVKDWVKHGWQGGSFFMLMMEHNIYEAIAHADYENQTAIVNWVKFMNSYLPYRCHGSLQRVDEWYNQGGLCGKPEAKAG